MIFILNADDFGRNHKTNERIDRCIRNGLVSAASIMPNMPEFDEAVEYIKKNNYPDRIGVHIVLDEGRPLTNGMQKCKKFCDKTGCYKKSIPRHQFLSRLEIKLVYNEITAQIDRVINAGILPTHIDFHRHRHQDLFVSIAVRKALVDRDIKYIRRGKTNCGTLRKLFGSILMKYYSLFYRVYSSDSFISINDFSTCINMEKGVFCEIMCHPEQDNEYEDVLRFEASHFANQTDVVNYYKDK